MSSWDDDDFEPDLRGATLGDDTLGDGNSATPPPGDDSALNEGEEGGGGGDDDAGWFGTRETTKEAHKGAASSTAGDRPPLLLIDFTVLSGGALHNKHDPAACNDPEKKRALTKACTAEFARYRDDTALISAGVVRPCGASVWRAALAELRADNPGHFWAPIFPPRDVTN